MGYGLTPHFLSDFGEAPCSSGKQQWVKPVKPVRSKQAPVFFKKSSKIFIKTKYAYFPHNEYERPVSYLATACPAVLIVPLFPSSQTEIGPSFMTGIDGGRRMSGKILHNTQHFLRNEQEKVLYCYLYLLCK